MTDASEPLESTTQITDRVSLEEVQDAVRKELDGPGKLLGYRAMQNRYNSLIVQTDTN